MWHYLLSVKHKCFPGLSQNWLISWLTILQQCLAVIHGGVHWRQGWDTVSALTAACVPHNTMQHSHKSMSIYNKMCNLLFHDWKVWLSCSCHCYHHSVLRSLPSHVDATFSSSCLGVIQRRTGKCGSVTEFKACWVQMEKNRMVTQRTLSLQIHSVLSERTSLW